MPPRICTKKDTFSKSRARSRPRSREAAGSGSGFGGGSGVRTRSHPTRPHPTPTKPLHSSPPNRTTSHTTSSIPVPFHPSPRSTLLDYMVEFSTTRNFPTRSKARVARRPGERLGCVDTSRTFLGFLTVITQSDQHTQPIPNGTSHLASLIPHPNPTFSLPR